VGDKSLELFHDLCTMGPQVLSDTFMASEEAMQVMCESCNIYINASLLVLKYCSPKRRSHGWFQVLARSATLSAYTPYAGSSTS